MPWRPIILVGVAMVLFYMVDTGVQTWGPLFLDHTFTTPERYVALSALAYLLASGAGPASRGDRLVARFGVGRSSCASARWSAPAALAVVVFSPTWQVAVRRLRDPRRRRRGRGAAELLGGGPDRRAAEDGVEFEPAVRQARVDAVIARFNQFNYVGALLGSVMTGLVGQDSLRSASPSR